MKDISIQELKNTAVQMRMKVIDMIYKAQSGHPGGSPAAFAGDDLIKAGRQLADRQRLDDAVEFDRIG